MGTDRTTIRWRLHLASTPEVVYEALSTDAGRARFWAEEARRRGDHIAFRFPNGMTWSGRVLDEDASRRYVLEYFGTTVAFELRPDGRGGTDLELVAKEVAPEDREGFLPGWVSVLLSLKAAVDFGVDLRNHDASRTWDDGYVDN